MCGRKAAQKAAATPMRTSARKLALAFIILVFCVSSACSAAAGLAAFLTAIWATCLVATAAASAADFLVVFITSFGIRNVPSVLCWQKTWWS